MSTTFNLHECPFCNTELINSTVHCPNYKKYSCLECPECHSYFFTKNNYNILYNLAEKEGQKLSDKVHYYNTETSIWREKSTYNPKIKNSKKTKNTSVKRKKNNSNIKRNGKTIQEIPYEKVKKQKTIIIYTKAIKNCLYFNNKICTYFNDMCNPRSFKCKNPNILLTKGKHLSQQIGSQQQKHNIADTQLSKNPQYVKAIVLSHNRKCVFEEHHLISVTAIIKVLTTNNNKVIDIKVPAAYCKECNQHIILKTDFKSIKQKGTLLCHVIDETPEYIAKHKNSSYSGTESKVHRLGYNVIKQGYNYTFAQRKIILANIIENYGITQHEILSMLDTNIARKINLSNYEEAVAKWQQDREFIANYKTGDVPEVIIDEVVIGKRK
ncbi:MAG: hypothetical protein NC313_07545 [Butyrivibrio sp.]|nr:hypothetical protein [Butyrivibrio sp.]